MPSPPIALFLTTIASQPALRQRQEYILRILQVKKIPFTTYDLASDEDAKRLWRRKAPQGKQQLPGILVGMKYPGSFEEFEDAVEHDELDVFLRLNEKWDPSIDEDRPMPEVKPVGVPGAASPLQMTPDHLKSKMYPQGTTPPTSSPLAKKTPVNKRTGELDMGEELSGFGLQGVKVTQDELLALMAELGLDKTESDKSAKVAEGTTKPLKLKTVKKSQENKAEQDVLGTKETVGEDVSAESADAEGAVRDFAQETVPLAEEKEPTKPVRKTTETASASGDEENGATIAGADARSQVKTC
ncbi:hypothetical protein D9613_002117 [Agrocybe pediades]|uniref:SH3 domain-binding glutamic acid-rich protein n=1 Tax=Agrocybe pediades TaxID=84607 RepID=A0A8H4VUL2_9AGAR|nr:hypothetical protein D9613_002117 [Agrocybe pediades]